MKTKSDTLSWIGRFAKKTITGELHYSQMRFAATAYFVISIGWLIVGMLGHGTYHYISSATFGALALITILSAGFLELIEKEYKKNSNQGIEPIGNTSVD